MKLTGNFKQLHKITKHKKYYKTENLNKKTPQFSLNFLN